MLVPPKATQVQSKPINTPRGSLPRGGPPLNINSPKQLLEQQSNENQATANAAKMAQNKLPKSQQVRIETPRIATPMMNKIKNDIKNATSVPRSYVMVVSSFENVSKSSEISSDAAEQMGKTIEDRLSELNRAAQRVIEDLPEYKKLEIDNIEDLGEAIADMLTNEDDQLKAFAFLKKPEFAGLMDSTESAHRSFADMMQDNGEEKLLFGAIQASSMMRSPMSQTPNAVSIKV